MSSIEQPVDQQLIEQTRRQIQALVNEIAQLSKQNVAPGEFYSQFLARVVSAMAAVGGAVWAINEDNRWPCSTRSISSRPTCATTKRPRPATAACCARP